MPFRSPKMYSFIFGFQRRVWWPKWTPASRSSFIVISTANVPPLRKGRFEPRSSPLHEESAAASFFAEALFGRVFYCFTTTAKCELRLALAELEATARALLAVLL